MCAHPDASGVTQKGDAPKTQALDRSREGFGTKSTSWQWLKVGGLGNPLRAIQMGGGKMTSPMPNRRDQAAPAGEYVIPV